MPRARTIQISGLNVAMHSPHSPEKYIELLRLAKSAGHRFEQGELHRLMLGTWYAQAPADKQRGVLAGEIYRFVNIDPNEPWFNIQTSQPATSDEMGAVSIPSHLRAHLQTIPFVFDAKRHLLWFISKDKKSSLGPLHAQRFFQHILSKTATEHQLPAVEVTVLPTQNALDEIFGIYTLTHLVIELKRPNPDDGASATRAILRRMQEQGIRTTRTQHTAAPNQSIKPDDETRQLAEVAAMNGSVTGIGRDIEGVPVTETTTEKPMRLHERVMSNIETALDALKRRVL